MEIESNFRNIPPAVVIVSIVSAILTIVHLFVPGVTVDAIGLALFCLAILPWMIPYLQRSVKNIDILGNKIEFLETEVSKQQRIINDLVIFSISSSLFEILCHIYYRREYRYIPNDGSQRALRFLRDHGYVHYFRFDELQHSQDLSQALRLTPAGELLVLERERREIAK